MLNHNSVDQLQIKLFSTWCIAILILHSAFTLTFPEVAIQTTISHLKVVEVDTLVFSFSESSCKVSCPSNKHANPGLQASVDALILEDPEVDVLGLVLLALDELEGLVSQPPAIQPPKPIRTQYQLGRRLLYTHHIRSPIKRRDIIQACTELSLGGFSKIGNHGLILVEGNEPACVQFVAYVTSMRWKFIVVRGEQQLDIVDNLLDMNKMRVFPLPLIETTETNLVKQCCEQNQLVDLWNTYLGKT